MFTKHCSFRMNTCLHENDITDYREGTIVCTDCGVVKDLLFENVIGSNDYHSKVNSLGDVENILDQLHIPKHLSYLINSNMNLRKKSIPIDKSCVVNKMINVKKLASEIYNTVNESESILLLKDIANFSHLEPSQIKSKNIQIVDLSEILERYTTKFDMDFRSCSIIREKITQFNNTGYQPLTIIGGVIYLYHINIRKKISMKKIATTLGISSISIQRFIKKFHNAFSSRS